MGGTLGMVVVWGGYTLFVWGFSKYRWGRNQGSVPGLTISDCALPSHRGHYLDVMTTTTAAPGAAAINSSTKSRLIAEAQAQVALYCVPGKPTGPGSLCAGAKASLAQAQAS